KTSSAHIASFKGKLLILDFWGVTCSSCIAEMPKMQRLQQEFGDKIQILLVTRDSYNGLGFHVWIDAASTVAQKTQAGTYSDREIKGTLAGQKLALPDREDILDFNPSQPLWLEG